MELQNTVKQALNMLYHHPDDAVRMEADLWLQKFQRTIDAWQAADNLLHDSASNIETLIFCSQTLRSKVQRDFEELPSEAFRQLRVSLNTLLKSLHKGPPKVRTQEIFNYKISVRPERRRTFENELASGMEIALCVLTACLNINELTEQVLEAFASWLRLRHRFPASALASHPLVLTALSSLDSDILSEASVNVISELIHYTAVRNLDGVAAQMPLIQAIVPRIMNLKAQLRDPSKDEEDVKAIARLIADMGDAYVELIATGSDESMMIVQALLEVASHPEFDIASMTFNFWHSLQIILVERSPQVAYGSGSSVEAEKFRRLQVFRPSYESLVSLNVGVRIQATMRIGIYNELEEKKKMVEGKVYRIKDFCVMENTTRTKTTPHEFRILLHKQTHILDYEKGDFPMIMYAPRDLEDIALNRNIDQSVLLDVIGMVVSFQPPCNVPALNTKRFDFKIEDTNGIQISCSLWGDYMNELLSVLEQEIEKPVIVIIQLGKINRFRYSAELKVSNTFYVSKVIVNGTQEIFQNFRQRLGDREIVRARQLMSDETNEIYQDFASGKAKVRSIKFLNGLKDKGLDYWVVGTVIDIMSPKGCWYLACKECYHKVYAEGDVKRCLYCGEETVEDILRYKIKILVGDDSGCCTLLLWNKQCVALLGDLLIDKRVFFEVIETPNKNVNLINHYTVGRLTFDEDIFELYKQKYPTNNKDSNTEATDTLDVKGKGKCNESPASEVSIKVQYPQDYADLSREDQKDFKQTRYAVADVLIDAALVLGGDATLRILHMKLFEATNCGHSEHADWRPVEAALYSIRAISDYVSTSDGDMMPQIMSLLPKLPHQPQLLQTVCLVIGEYSKWFDAAPSGLSFLPPLIDILVSGMSTSEDTAAAAAVAFRHICDDCKKKLCGSLDGLFQIYQRAVMGDGPFKVSAEDSLHLVEALSMVITELPSEHAKKALESLCLLAVTPLQEIISQHPLVLGQKSPRELTVHIDRLANIFRHVNHPEAVADAVQRLWPIFKAIFDIHSWDMRTMESLCRACKNAVRTSKTLMGVTIGVMLEEIQSLYKQHQQPCFLYLSSEVIKIYGSDPSCTNYLKTLIESLFSHTTIMLAKIEDFSSRPDLVDDCFLLASRCIRYCPQLFFPSPVFPCLVDCAMIGLTVQHREASNSILSFLSDIFDIANSSEGKPYTAIRDNVIVPRGPAITRILVAALTGALPSSRIETVTYALLALTQAYGVKALEWAKESISLIPPNAIKEVERSRFLQALSDAISGAAMNSLMTPIEELSEVCRRNRSVQEIVQGALRPLELNLISVS
ncbi:hypothetical protein CASFOL_038326 [Castilleja foliolosa]|uniref:Transportin-3 n=1 Tax=Castilleja foliolosa TaxID=1961234 RepID=A0ABD3BKQ4_9LAMI